MKSKTQSNISNIPKGNNVHIEYVDEVNARVLAEDHILELIYFEFKFQVPNAGFLKKNSRKLRGWDGFIHLFDKKKCLINTGLVPRLSAFLKANLFNVTFGDWTPVNHINRNDGFDYDKFVKVLPIHIKGEPKLPRDFQMSALKKIFKSKRALILSPTGSGKSMIIYMMTLLAIAEFGDRVLIVVPNTGLVDQLAENFDEFAHRKLPIHKIYEGASKECKSKITIATWQSIYTEDQSFFDQFGSVVFDEAHHASSKSLKGILDRMPHTHYRVGFTATTNGTEVHEWQLEGAFGPAYETITTKNMIDRGFASDIRIVGVELDYPDHIKKSIPNDYQKEIEFLIECESRNKFIRDMAIKMKGVTLVLFRFVENHGEPLREMIEADATQKVYYVSGKTKTEERTAIKNEIKSSIEDCIIVASYGTFSQGIDIPRIDNVIFASPYRSRIKVLQSIGRSIRKHKDKKYATIIDIYDNLTVGDNTNYGMRHYFERLKIYKDQEFKVRGQKIPPQSFYKDS